MSGDTASALEYAKRLDGKIDDEVAAKIGWIQLIKQAPYFAHAHLSDADTILALEDPGDRFPLVKVGWHYARGVAYAQQGEVEKARGEAAVIAAINQDPNVSYPTDIAPIVADVLRIARHVIEGRIAQAEGDGARAVREFGIAVQIQDSLAYLEPPFWYYPVRQSLGAALLEAGKPAQAEQVFAESLAKVPNDGRALFGLLQAQKAQGKDAAMKETEARFRQAWVGDPEVLSLERL
jgi:tetratricopeptide (TPR) repeat protein